MRYSLLVYLIDMVRSLIEASIYLSGSSDDAIKKELYDNGQIMISQLKDVLVQYKDDLKSDIPLNKIEKIDKLWKESSGTGNDVVTALDNLASVLPQEIDYKVRAVFVAELGEKWDSMASVYEYMKNDPRFDPVVVMEPVFREVQQGDKIVRDVIYRDYLTPMGIPFFEHDKYSFEADQPDLAFICQPYESCTLPKFWPENIAKYTRLVYLPYFFIGSVSESHILTMCQMPVYVHSWKVVGASEKHKEFYSKHAPNGGENMIVTGLPKLDGLATLKERGVPLPKGWEKIKGKRTMLLNTWYSLNEKLFDLLEWQIRWFDAHKDCALIWRPHPMTDTVTKLYYPALYARYRNYLERMQDSFNIVVDQEVSYKAAFYYSDTLNSARSSMVSQYLLMDKPTVMWGSSSDAALFRLIDYTWLEDEDGEGYYDRVLLQGIDKKADVRKEILKRDLPLADGKSYERVCNALWEAMHEEDGILNIY